MNDKRLVLRSIYLDPQKDEDISAIAKVFGMSRSKCIRRLIELGLNHTHEFLKIAGQPPLNNFDEFKGQNITLPKDFVLSLVEERIVNDLETNEETT